MSRTADAPLQKITINIFTADYELFKDYYGQGWSDIMRRVVKEHADKIRKEMR